MKLTLEQLHKSWSALHSLASQTMAAGKFRRNLRKVYEQCKSEHEMLETEMTALLNEFGQQVSPGQWSIENDRTESFNKRLGELYSVEIEIRGDRILEADLESYGIRMSPVDEILLSWLISEFPSEIEQTV